MFVDIQVEQIGIMKMDMNDKARDIMNKREDTAYLGRNIFLQGEKFLKQMKEQKPNDKLQKLEASRLLMKDRAKNKGKCNIKRHQMNEESY